MTAATRDREASARLWAEIQSELARRGERPSKSALSAATSIARPTLDNWLVHGVQPPVDGMRRIAQALGLDPARLWLRWLDIPLPDAALERIATALEHIAFADPPSSPEAEALEVSRRAAELARDAIPTSPRRAARRRVEA